MEKKSPVFFSPAGPINLPRRLNSGFYFARSDGSTIAAMEKVVRHAATSGLSEQPSFYDTLCGEGGSNRKGDNRCVEPETNLTIHFLDRNPFPNGAYLGLWERKNVKSACKKLGCIVLHNNWIDQLVLTKTLEFPFSLVSLLSFTADKNRTVVLTVAGYSYKDMLMSWVCRLRRLRVTNFLVCALDYETYQFSIIQVFPLILHFWFHFFFFHVSADSSGYSYFDIKTQY